MCASKGAHSDLPNWRVQLFRQSPACKISNSKSCRSQRGLQFKTGTRTYTNAPCRIFSCNILQCLHSLNGLSPSKKGNRGSTPGQLQRLCRPSKWTVPRTTPATPSSNAQSNCPQIISRVHRILCQYNPASFYRGLWPEASQWSPFHPMQKQNCNPQHRGYSSDDQIRIRWVGGGTWGMWHVWGEKRYSTDFGGEMWREETT